MEEVIGKTKTFKNGILKRVVRVGIETFDPNKIANGFNKSFIEIEPKLASSTPTSSKYFKQLMDVSEAVLQENVHQD